MINYGRQAIDGSDIKAVIRVLGSDYLTQGPAVVKFETALARYCGAKYALAVSSGTAALHLAYLAAGLGERDEVITSANTFAATANMLKALKAKPVFCDISLNSYNIDEIKISQLINKKTKAIVPVHFAGQPCRLDKIKKIAKKYKLLVIEDACHALGARYKKNKIGDCRYSNMAVFSFHAVKSITSGEGGAVLTNNKTIYDRLKLLRSHGIYKDRQGKNVMIALGYNYRLTDIQAALGLSQLKRLNRFIKRRHQVVAWYRQELSQVKEIILPVVSPASYSAWHIYVIRTVKPKDRDGLMSFLKQHGIGVNFHYPAVYSHLFYRNNGYKNFKLAKTDLYHSSCLTLPCHTLLTKPEIKYIAGKIKLFFRTKQQK
jgi:perosamine synthetase